MRISRFHWMARLPQLTFVGDLPTRGESTAAGDLANLARWGDSGVARERSFSEDKRIDCTKALADFDKVHPAGRQVPQGVCATGRESMS